MAVSLNFWVLLLESLHLLQIITFLHITFVSPSVSSCFLTDISSWSSLMKDVGRCRIVLKYFIVCSGFSLWWFCLFEIGPLTESTPGIAVKSCAIWKIYCCGYVLAEASNLNVVAGVPKRNGCVALPAQARLHPLCECELDERVSSPLTSACNI